MPGTAKCHEEDKQGEGQSRMCVGARGVEFADLDAVVRECFLEVVTGQC